MFETLVNELIKETAKNRQLKIDTGIETLAARVAAEDELRVFVDGTVNFGHQSASVFVMKWCIERLRPKQVLMIYRPGPPEEPTLAKLAALLPNFDGNPASTIKVEGVDVKFLEWNTVKPVKQVLLAVSGGADTDDEDQQPWLATMNVRLFLRLQPYLWDDAILAPNEIVYYEGVDEKELKFNDVFHEPFERRAWITPVEYLEPIQWAQLADKYAEVKKEQILVSQQLFNSLEANAKVLMSPVYGLRYSNQTRAFGTSNVTSLAASIAKGQAVVKQPAVICLLSDPLDVAGDKKLLDRMLAGGPSEEEATRIVQRDDAQKVLTDLQSDEEAKKDKDYGARVEEKTEELAQLAKSLNAYDNRKQEFETLGMDVRAKYYANPTMEGVEALIPKLGPADIAVLQVVHTGADEKPISLPPPVFNVLFRQGKLPSVFEGANTATTAISLGKPYLHLRGERYDDQEPDVVLYPSVLVSADGNYDKIAVYSQTASNALVFSIPEPERDIEDAVKKDIFTTYSEHLGAFLAQSQNGDGELAAYFRDIARFYNSPVEDKISLAAGFLGSALPDLAPVVFVNLLAPPPPSPPGPTPPPAA